MENCKYWNDKLVKNGISETDKQQYYCQSCKKSFTEGKFEKYSNEFKIKTVKDSFEGVGIRALARIKGIGTTTLLRWLNKASKILKENIVENINLAEGKPDIIEIDEMVDFVKKNQKKSGYGLLLVDGKVAFLQLK